MTSENESSSGNELEIIINEDDINEHDKSISSSGSDEADEGSSDDDNNNENTDEDIQDPAEPDDDIQGEKKTSDVWQHFDNNEDNSTCKYCKKTYSKNTSTTILRRHYEKNHQKKINKTKQTTLQFSTSTPHPDEIMRDKTNSIMEWIILDLQPFSVVESESFIKLINKLDPHYRLPSRHTIKRLIIDVFEEKRKIISNFFQNSTFKFSLTCDIWSSVKMESFMALTIHYIDSKWKLCHFVLDIFNFTGSHTGTAIFEEISKLIIDMHLENKVIAITTDNGSNIVSGCKKLVEHFNPGNEITGLTHYRCSAHIINLAVNEGLSISQSSIKKLRKFVKKIRESALLIDDLKHIFQSDGKAFLRPQLDIKTRWNSTFEMINRAIEIKLQLETLKVRQSNLLSSYWPTDQEWNELHDIKEILSEFAMATTELSGQTYPTAAHVRILFLSLISYLNSQNDPNHLLSDMIDKIKQKLERYWNIIDENSKISAFFDPRYKNLCFSGMDTNSVLGFIRQKFPFITQSQSQVQIQTNSRMSHFLSRLSNNQPNILIQRDEISSYWNLACASQDITPLDWWKAHETEYPLLSKAAQDYLGIMATSVPCEQLFSIAGLTITKSRNRLTGKSARAILCLKSWLKEKII